MSFTVRGRGTSHVGPRQAVESLSSAALWGRHCVAIRPRRPCYVIRVARGTEQVTLKLQFPPPAPRLRAWGSRCWVVVRSRGRAPGARRAERRAGAMNVGGGAWGSGRAGEFAGLTSIGVRVQGAGLSCRWVCVDKGCTAHLRDSLLQGVSQRERSAGPPSKG